ncbi:MAG: acylphosphatase [Candidatus Omnitrophota bacterium]|nr:acylphosphatase [Candidatus Omnitrophota bacterium]
MKKRYNILFSGSVQGVGFRFTVRNLANRYRLTGGVRNTHDGKVEVEIEGDLLDLNNFLQSLQQEFPNNISDYKKEELPVSEEYEGFYIKF